MFMQKIKKKGVYSLNYANGNPIQQCTEDFDGLKTPREEYKKKNRINISLLADEVTFANLYQLWIEPWLSIMRDFDKDIKTLFENPLLLFYEGAKEEDGEKLLQKFQAMLLGFPPYEAICPMCPYDTIIQQTNALSVPYYIKLRVKIICLILSIKPDQAFDEGVHWVKSFPSDAIENDFVEVTDGMKFPLKLEKGVEDLYPRTLYNAGVVPCSIILEYEKIDGTKIDYRISLPVEGVLRVVFGNKQCDYIVSVKGNISFNPNGVNAIIQQAKKTHTALYQYMPKYKQSVKLKTEDYFLDAAANGEGGAVILTKQGLYNTRQNTFVKKERLPMRVYGAGDFCAVHYADGTLESDDIEKKNGTSFQKVIAVVENGEASLMIRDSIGAWDCQGGTAEEITEEEFVACMLKRFSYEEECERCSTDFMSLSIKIDGTLSE